ncbi:bifunctional tRNA (5-methylaminomethyl-2-thiouridine)(34)-methyltransferase MnmD/FAD-dependent 5-carboxymethylaminomethyl-2-thiouridine(34) oxidoreductase MnmC [Trinickia caryophylli]|uniref:tRNA 5-methylaminomethyl-2-thiouridine biosynthesis bifunctional protein MnmC n=1 Tax=Trinickia caryophylli TaxID=28094 RepID=A0A1X7GRM5_TRICW|nr:bifunctional tRNA (5-methylaminomethyl-2-thiouridine)(34)-methyltransferase MnmD/FAD-dependent 5-carboxymethylaminomethyl-2-thiouridine(34) oxidoreductase MnmC [Trinickia caryophylli]PMS10575.1 bifunctional tRNA (5-methylaminomethyl-2-thiouridine)(34)-methyltransferase MnmD/FAD-dependent 5-carboxymethylaminomethyl-2-thiouridine(34) oxidoreductase MnmC [Trinickia caryophylli]TRX19030.1 bifunctional tRNA (5-methylaminomethyl-2-thiouridine)(34)-methyltransferase MnmD/FAD-dependent 5-carboxymethyl
MTVPLAPAQLAFREDGTPFSPLYGDIYHSTAGAFAQAQHVFIEGNGLPHRWRGRRLYTILETGFGLGGNFLATWAAWRADSNRPERLAFVSIEKHPFSRDDLHRLHDRIVADATVAPLAAQLVDAWPMLVGGVHRLEFEGSRVSLTIAFGDAQDMLPKLRLRADALYLDGFAPDKNPELWSAPVYKGLARLAAPDATLATYTCAGHVRRGLEAAGFACDKAPGFAGKREMLIGRFAPRWRVRRHEPPLPFICADRHAIVVGAGLAGAALVERLASRGWRVTVLERHARAAQEASGNPAGVFHPLLSRDDSMASRITRAGFLHALRRWDALEQAGHAFERSRNGLLQLPADEQEAAALTQAIARFGYPAELVAWLPAAEAARLTGAALGRGGLFYPRGGSLSPAALSAALCAAAGSALDWRAGANAAHIVRSGERWSVLDDQGGVLASAEVVVFANAHEAARVAGLRHAPTRLVRGQLTRLPPGLAPWLHLPLIGEGYAVPLDDGLLTGATYEIDDAQDDLRASGHLENTTRLAALVPTLAGELSRLDSARLAGRVGFRCVTGDRLPMVGALGDETQCLASAAALRGAQLADLPRSAGLYGSFAFGSRGLVWASLAAELVACQIEGEPWPIEQDLADALDPARYLLRALRHGELER